MKINEKGIWENETAEGHVHDEGLAKGIVKFLETAERSFIVMDVLDIGCGTGYYVSYINEHLKFPNNGYAICHGIDGNPHTYEISNNNWNLSIEDITKPIDRAHRYDWVISLEVGEHIPVEFESEYIRNLDTHNKYGIILSWAVRGQGGDGHVNCLDNGEVIEKIEPLGYVLDAEATMTLRQACAKYPKDGYWFRNTIMVFRRLKDGSVSS